MERKQLIEYLPEFLREVRENKELLNAIEPELDLLTQRVQDLLDDAFFLTLTEYGAVRWEQMLHITPKATATLSERQFEIFIRANERLPFTIRTLRNFLAQLCGADGYKVDLQTVECLLSVWVALTAKSNLDDVAAMLRRVVPANLVINLSLLYNQHRTLAPYTHEHLQQCTYEQLRSEVLT